MGYGNTEMFLSAQEREDMIGSLMGKTVDAVIDRPIGHTHVTKGITLHDTINYGFLPGTMGGDGEEQDVYVLGVDVPLETFRGRVIAAIRRRDDNEDKLVMASEDAVFSAEEIRKATWFVEKYFDSTIQTVWE